MPPTMVSPVSRHVPNCCPRSPPLTLPLPVVTTGVVSLLSVVRALAPYARTSCSTLLVAPPTALYAAGDTASAPVKATNPEGDYSLVAAKFLQQQVSPPKGIGNEVYCYYTSTANPEEFAIATLLEDASLTAQGKIFSVGNNVVWASGDEVAPNFVTACPDATGFDTKSTIGVD